MSDDQNVDRGDEFDPFADQPEDTTESPAEPPSEPAVEATSPEPEAEAPVAEAKAEEEAPKEHMIPKGRFDQAVQKERQEKELLQSRLQQFEEREAQRAAAVDTEAAQKQMKELIKEHTSMLADGELDKAADVMSNILQIQQDMAEAKATAAATSAKDNAKAEVQYDSVVQKLEAEYPEINPDSEVFDRDAVRRVQTMVTGIMQMERKSPAAALQEAVEILLKPAKEAAAAENLRQQPSEEAAATGMRRKEAAVQKNIEASKQQPPDTKEVGLDHDKEGGSLDAAAVAKMSWDEFVKLPEDQLSRMRGDHVN